MERLRRKCSLFAFLFFIVENGMMICGCGGSDNPIDTEEIIDTKEDGGNGEEATNEIQISNVSIANPLTVIQGEEITIKGKGFLEGFHSESAQEHGYRHFIDQRRSNQKGKSNSQRDAALHKPDEQRNGRAGAERGDGTEQSCQEVLQPVHLVGSQIRSQPVDGEVGIDDAHQYTDEKQQNQNLDAVVEEEVYGDAQRGVGTQTENSVNQPVGKCLYHNLKSFISSSDMRSRCLQG